MQGPEKITVTEDVIKQWLAEKLSIEEVETKLSFLNLPADEMMTRLKEFKQMRRSKRNFTGFALMASGAFLGFISCVLSLFNPIPELYNLFLYGFTSLAIILVIWGLYYVVE